MTTQPNRQQRRAASRSKGAAPTPLRTVGGPQQETVEQVGFMDNVERELISRINEEARLVQEKGQKLSVEIVKRHGIDPQSGSFQLLSDGRIVRLAQAVTPQPAPGANAPTPADSDPEPPAQAAE